jgi:hypothetical protein
VPWPRPISAADVDYLLADLALPAGAEGRRMKGWMSQIVIGIIVTVVGTVIANAIISGKGGRGFFGGGYHGGPARGGR